MGALDAPTHSVTSQLGEGCDTVERIPVDAAVLPIPHRPNPHTSIITRPSATTTV